MTTSAACAGSRRISGGKSPEPNRSARTSRASNSLVMTAPPACGRLECRRRARDANVAAIHRHVPAAWERVVETQAGLRYSRNQLEPLVYPWWLELAVSERSNAPGLRLFFKPE